MFKIGLFAGIVQAADDTVVSINPASQTIAASADFEVNVSCAPGQPIKAYELKLSQKQAWVLAYEFETLIKNVA